MPPASTTLWCCQLVPRPNLGPVLTAAQLDKAGSATTRASRVSACLVLTQCDRHLSCVIAHDASAVADGVALLATRIVRFVDNGWSEQSAAELRIMRDGTQWGVCDPERRWWVPYHTLVPYRLVELAPAEHARLIGHIDQARPWDLFKYIQLVYLGEDGFSGGRDALTAPTGYGNQTRTDRWYFSAQAR